MGTEASAEASIPGRTSGPARSGRDLIAATKEHATESALRSWWSLLSTLALFAAGTAGAALAPWWPLRLALAVVDGLLIVRLFIVFHDYLHGAILRGSRVAPWILYPYGVLVMNPPNVWRETHNYHHNHTAQIVGSSIGSFAMMTTTTWKTASKAERRHYRLVRHPLTVVFGYFTIFMLEMCLASFLRAPRKRWDSAVAVVLNWGLSALLWIRFGPAVFFFAFFAPLFIACGVGAYLFYVQHNFPGLFIQPRQTWSYDRAALESSSYMETGKVMAWFTGNIGYHHVHHLNPTIPFYRLPEAMAAIPELQNAQRTRLTWRSVADAFALKLWDQERGEMVGFPE